MESVMSARVPLAPPPLVSAFFLSALCIYLVWFVFEAAGAVKAYRATKSKAAFAGLFIMLYALAVFARFAR